MTTLLGTVMPEISMAEAHRLMLTHNHQTLPVVDDEKRLVGVVSLQDVHLAKRRIAERGMDLGGAKIKSWVHRNVITVEQDTAVPCCREHARRERAGHAVRRRRRRRAAWRHHQD